MTHDTDSAPEGEADGEHAARGLRIVAAAFNVGCMIVSAPPPARHGDLFRGLDLDLKCDPYIPPSAQGFLTNRGEFVDREKARRIAVEAGQLLPRHHSGPELYSEDVW